MAANVSIVTPISPSSTCHGQHSGDYRVLPQQTRPWTKTSKTGPELVVSIMIRTACRLRYPKTISIFQGG
jgi:hypothetical protein